MGAQAGGGVQEGAGAAQVVARELELGHGVAVRVSMADKESGVQKKDQYATEGIFFRTCFQRETLQMGHLASLQATDRGPEGVRWLCQCAGSKGKGGGGNLANKKESLYTLCLRVSKKMQLLQFRASQSSLMRGRSCF